MRVNPEPQAVTAPLGARTAAPGTKGAEAGRPGVEPGAAVAVATAWAAVQVAAARAARAAREAQEATAAQVAVGPAVATARAAQVAVGPAVRAPAAVQVTRAVLAQRAVPVLLPCAAIKCWKKGSNVMMATPRARTLAVPPVTSNRVSAPISSSKDSGLPASVRKTHSA